VDRALDGGAFLFGFLSNAILLFFPEKWCFSLTIATTALHFFVLKLFLVAF
jgi:hypothetical protein